MLEQPTSMEGFAVMNDDAAALPVDEYLARCIQAKERFACPEPEFEEGQAVPKLAPESYLQGPQLLLFEQLRDLFPEASSHMLARHAACGDVDMATGAILEEMAPGATRGLSQGDMDMIGQSLSRTASRASEEDADRDVLNLMGHALPDVPRPALKAALREASGDLALALNLAKGAALDIAAWEAYDPVEKLVGILQIDTSRATELLKKTENDINAAVALAMGEKATAAAAAATPVAQPPAPAPGAPAVTQDGWEIICRFDPKKGTCQSARSLKPGEEPGQIVVSQVGTDNTAAYAATCFEHMLQREQEMEKTHVVFYHAYNTACLIYEVQAEVARQLYGLEDHAPPLPRILRTEFVGKSMKTLLNEFSKMQGRDHNPAFRALAISVSNTLFSFGSEAPPLQCFRAGYGCGDLSFQGLLDSLLQHAGAEGTQVSEMRTALVKLGGEYGLPVGPYGGSGGGRSALGGHMLQIFVEKKTADEIAYRSQPYGVVIKDGLTISQYLAGKGKPSGGERLVDGQARLLMFPEVFLDAKKTQMYHYCGNWEFLGGDTTMDGSRAKFVMQMRDILKPLFATPADVAKCRGGIEGTRKIKK